MWPTEPLFYPKTDEEFHQPPNILFEIVYESLNRQNVPTDLLADQERRTSPFASHVACTVEIVTLQREFDVAVTDEIQMISHELKLL